MIRTCTFLLTPFEQEVEVMEQDIRLAYSALTHQIRVSFGALAIHESKPSAKDFVRRAKAKLEDEMAKGLIENYVLYDEQLEAFWDHLQTLDPDELQRTASFVLAQGFRSLREARLVLDPSSKVWRLTLPSDAELVQKAGWYRIQAWVMHKTNTQPHRDPVLKSRIIEAFFRATKGDPVQDFPLRASPIEITGTGSRVLNDKEAQRVLLLLYEGRMLRDAEELNGFIQKISAHLSRLQEKSSQYISIKKELQEFLKDLIGGPESFGFGLPLFIPIAYIGNAESAQLSAKGSAEINGAKEKPKDPTAKKKKGRSADQLLEFEVIDDAMEARISWANDAKLMAGNYDSDKAWLEKALADAGIKHGYQNFIETILNRLMLKESIRGQVVAMGTPAQIGEKPYLFPSYLHRKIEGDEDQVDIRSSQNKLIVDVGDVICELHYHDGSSGMDVYGKAKLASQGPVLDRIEVGPGVERRDDGKFYALIRGIPKLDRHFYVACREIYTHDGDINLKSGDLHFDGDIEVRGSVDNGARVYAKGHLLVRGSIGQARVRCGGDLDVLGGIITSQDCFVIAGGKVSAQFIENSRVIAGQDVVVLKSIVNSHVKSGGQIEVRSTRAGIIGGGSLIAQGGMKTFKLGFHDGEKTFLRIGSDWQTEFRIDILQRRVQRLRKFQQARQLEIEELKRRNVKGDKASSLEKRMTRARKLGDKIERAMEALKTKIRWDDRAVLVVQGELVNNLEITVNGRSVSVPNGSKEVMISGVRFKDQFVNSLIYLEQFRKARERQAS